MALLLLSLLFLMDVSQAKRFASSQDQTKRFGSSQGHVQATLAADIVQAQEVLEINASNGSRPWFGTKKKKAETPLNRQLMRQNNSMNVLGCDTRSQQCCCRGGVEKIWRYPGQSAPLYEYYECKCSDFNKEPGDTCWKFEKTHVGVRNNHWCSMYSKRWTAKKLSRNHA
eukprot:gnl/MRDRNA2_/MRDRNA2_110924_c0_seq1.p1 gnl/MRDRNA2_/MRDRNA2_110924_c0~~gnl/MRDRNA2_/MRDRNA2_110924_c0_seq1.p1  ORF type:complete len:170 (-),score=17.26 gnl/MRDRNA2_/MRDRNA2_110924_c0_seq1:4-513(-)